MHEALTIWKKIFTSPVTGFTLITPKTKIWAPMIIIIMLCILAAIPVLPVLASGAHHTARLKQIETLFQNLDSRNSELIQALFSKPTAFSVLLYSISAFTDQILTMAVTILYSALPLFIIGLFFKKRLAIKHYVTIFIYIAVIFAAEAFIKNIIVLFSDYTTMFQNADTIQEFQQVLTARISIASFIDPENMGTLSYITLDYFTDLFRLIFLVFVYFAIRGTWKTEKQQTLTAIIIYAMIGYLGVIIPILMG